MKDRVMSLSTENIEKFNLINSQTQHIHYDEGSKNNEEVKSHTTTDLDVMHISFYSSGIEFIPHEDNTPNVSL
jgi:hypothetical protein